MSLLQFLIIVTGVLFLFLSIDLYKRKKITTFHTVIFLSGILILILFAWKVELLNQFGQFFGVARGADLLVYISVISLLYMYFGLLNSHTREDIALSSLTSQLAISQIDTNIIEWQIKKMENDANTNYIFLLRAYNEGVTINKTLNEITKAGYNKIILVNDGSIDNTRESVRLFTLENPLVCLIYLEHTINRGRGGGGAALKTGFSFIKQFTKLIDAERVVTFDPDGQMDVADMHQFKVSQKNNPDTKLFLGSRFVAGSNTIDMPKARKVILALSRLSTRRLYQTTVSDPHCGYRVIHTSVIPLLKIQADSMHYANEINESINHHHITYEEVPVTISYTPHSLSKGQQNSNSISLGMQMLYKKFFFR